MAVADDIRKEDGYWPDNDDAGNDDKSRNKETTTTATTLHLTSPSEPFLTERMKQLFNAHGYNLAIFPGGIIKGEFLKWKFSLSKDIIYLLQLSHT